MSPDLPADLRAALAELSEGRPRAPLALRAAAISDAYRAGGGSAAIASADDALAYALARLPATYAAVAAVLSSIVQAAPDFAPKTLIDVGAGPGTAAFAAAQCYGSLARFDLIDHNAHLQRLARTLLAASASPALQEARYDRGDAGARLAACEPADLVLASYMIGEAGPERLNEAAEALWSRTAGLVAVIEPGTPAGYGRVALLRAHLIARGAHVLAPCPHALPCPIVPPDWCHFAQRLNRSREHRHIKGAELSYEDEKFAYVVLARAGPRRRFAARVLSPPQVGKVAVAAKLCRRDGTIATDTAPRRQRDAYKAHKAWRWGDAVETQADDRSADAARR